MRKTLMIVAVLLAGLTASCVCKDKNLVGEFKECSMNCIGRAGEDCECSHRCPCWKREDGRFRHQGR